MSWIAIALLSGGITAWVSILDKTVVYCANTTSS